MTWMAVMYFYVLLTRMSPKVLQHLHHFFWKATFVTSKSFENV